MSIEINNPYDGILDEINRISTNSIPPPPREIINYIPNTVNEPNEESSDSDEEINFSDFDFKQWYYEVLLNITNINFSLAYVICSLLFQFHVIYLFLYLLFHDFIHAIFLFNRLRREKSKKIKKRIILFLIEKTFGIVCKIMILIFFQIKQIQLIYTIIPLGTFCLVRCVYYTAEKNSGDCTAVFDFMTIGFRTFLFIQSITVSLKLDHSLNWDWKEIFWTYWVFFSILVGINFGLFLMVSSKFCQGLFSEVDSSELKGVFWLFLVCSQSTISSCLFVLGAIEFLDQSKQEKLNLCLYFIMISYLLIFLVSILLYKQIIKFIKALNLNESEIRDDHEANNKIELNSEKKQEPLMIPRFLLKFSSTYFKRANNEDTSIQKIKIKDDTKKKRKRFKTKHGRSNSQIDYNDIVNKGKSIAGSSIYELMGKNTEITLNTQNLFTQENCIVSIPTAGNDDEIIPKGFKNLKKIQYSNANTDRNQISPGLEIFNFELKNQTNNYSARQLRKSLYPIGLIALENNLDENKKKHMRSKSLNIIQTETINETNNYNPSIDNSKIFEKSYRQEEISSERVENLNKSVVNCLICFDNLPDAVFMECGHGGVCYNCSLELWKNTGECFLCRMKITQVLQIDLNNKNNKYIKVISSTQMVIEENKKNNVRSHNH